MNKEKKQKLNPYILIGERIKQIRLDKNIEKSVMAKELSISIKDVDNIENGKLKLTMDALFNISKILDTEMNYFLTGIFSNEIKEASNIIDKYIQTFKFIDGLSLKQKQIFSNMLDAFCSNKNQQTKK